MPHSYWRLLISNSPALNGYITIAEIEFRDALSGPNLAVAGAGTPSASSSFGTANDADEAIDGNTATFWAAQFGLPQWWRFQFNTPADILQVAVTASADYPLEAPSAFDVQYSDDGTNWTTRWSETGITTWAALQQRVFTAPGIGATTLEPLTSAGAGTVGAGAITGSAVAHVICLRGTWRPTIVLNATWVGR